MMKWISCKDRLPEVDTFILGYIDSPYILFQMHVLQVFIHRYGDKEMLMLKNTDRAWRLEDLSHWMPLPDAPKEV